MKEHVPKFAHFLKENAAPEDMYLHILTVDYCFQCKKS